MTSSNFSKANPHGGANPILAITALLSVLFAGLTICLAIEIPMATWPTWTIFIFGLAVLGTVILLRGYLPEWQNKDLVSTQDAKRVSVILHTLRVIALAALCVLLNQLWASFTDDGRFYTLVGTICFFLALIAIVDSTSRTHREPCPEC